MYSVRTTRTASLATAVQIVRYENRRKIIVKHIGSAKTSEEIISLKQLARSWIQKTTQQQSLFTTSVTAKSSLLPLDKAEYLGARYTFIYEALSKLLHRFRFHTVKKQFLLDLVLMRIIQPVSKLESLEYLSEMFGIQYGKSSLYKALFSFPALKTTIEEKVVDFAKQNFSFNFSIVFYDVTTLYFETFKEDSEKDSIRKPGFSKDNKPNQPQIVIGLIVTREGFPVAYEIFAGNTFEGKTFIPTIIKFKETYRIKTLTIVADAAMISFDNVEELKKRQLSYIVGARLASLKFDQMKQINKELINQTQDMVKLAEIGGASIRIETERGLLLCDFSLARYKKDKREMEKQIDKAEKLLAEKDALKRTKFIKTIGKTKQELNSDLIEKTRLLLGIKGYYTNLAEVDNATIINHYHNLWHVEKAFRIAKSDLAMRPIYHFRKQAIEAHILICFMALSVCKYMEIKTEKSTKKIIKLLKSITEARIKNKLTGEIILMRQELSEEVKQLWKTLSL